MEEVHNPGATAVGRPRGCRRRGPRAPRDGPGSACIPEGMHAPHDPGAPVLVWLDSAGSTQDEVLARVGREGPRHGLAVATADQRAGRGRHSRVWSAAPGAALALSVHLRPAAGGAPLAPVHLSWLSLVASAAVVEHLAGLGAAAHVKWPNDVLAPDGRKLCGVLATVAPAADGGGPGVVVGMGVNLDHRGAAPVATATDLAEQIGAEAVPAPREQLLHITIHIVQKFYLRILFKHNVTSSVHTHITVWTKKEHSTSYGTKVKK